MRFAIVCVVATLGGPVAAELSVEQRYLDCVGPQAEAQAHWARMSAPCQKTKSCGPLELYFDLSGAVATCATEAIMMCSGREAKLSSECIVRTVEMARQMHDVPNSILIPKLESIVATADSWPARRAKKIIEKLTSEPDTECTNLVSEDLLESPDAMCGLSKLFHRLVDVATAQYWIERETDQ